MANNSKATLQIALTEKVYAYQLHGLVFLIDDLYTSYIWLNRAEQHTGLQPYGDYEFNQEDFLVVKKLEIGTPNFIELYGWKEPLLTALTYLGGIGGIVSLLESGSAAYKNWKEARALKDKKEGKSAHEQAMEALALEKAQLENLLLGEKLKREEMLNQRLKSPYEQAISLQETGKISESAANFKGFSQNYIDLQIQKGVLETAIHINIIPD